MSKIDLKNYGEALRLELIEAVQEHLTPIALRYEYSSTALDSQIKWRPIVLILGNYSSGKSTLINELIGAEVQSTGQAPTDDSFTVITRSEQLRDDQPRALVDERDGYVLLNDPSYPFELLKKHGQRLASHFRLKRVNSPFLEDLAIIDTPGMLDSIAERDRGYSYQEVIGDLAQLADLILVMFDPHKAGTVRESYESLRKTLPQSTLEDRLVFVLNRIDECEHLNDLIRVYGTLCWNLSQMLGRKDIPKILLTYSEQITPEDASVPNPNFLNQIKNERAALKKMIEDAPRHRLDHLASYVETHGERLCHFLEAILSFARQKRRQRYKHWLRSVVFSLPVFGLVWGLLWLGEWPVVSEPAFRIILAATSSLLFLGFALGPWQKQSMARFRDMILSDADQLTTLATQQRRDSWERIRDLVIHFLAERYDKVPLSQIRSDLKEVQRATKRASKSAREALSEYYAQQQR